MLLRQLDKIKEQCSSFDTEMTLDEATAQQAELRTKVQTLRAKIKAAQVKLNAHNKKLQKMADAKNKLKEQMLNMQKKVLRFFSQNSHFYFPSLKQSILTR